MNPIINWVLVLAIPLAANAATTRVRRVSLAIDEIATVRTALGIATIIQVPDRPNSVVVGDLEAFKVEYLDQAITIKPLRRGVKSNLYVYTDYRRFNVQLVNSGDESADYVVYLENQKPKSADAKSALVWTSFKGRLTSDSLTLEIKRLGHAKNGVLIAEFQINGSKREAIKPEWIWVKQDGVTRPIQNLFLSNLEVKPGGSIQGVLQIQRSDIDTAKPLRIEFRRKKTSYLTIPKVSSWK
jgi:hypothetical protein